MYFDFNEKSTTLLIFFLHGLIFATLIFLKGMQTGEKSNYWLSAFVFLCSMYIAPFLFGYAGWYGNQVYRDILFYIPFQQLLLFPPVLYFYFKTLFDKSFSFSKKDASHFLPALAYLLYSIVVFITDKIVLKSYYFYADKKDKDLALWYQILGFISLVIYLLLSLKVYEKYKKIIYNTLSFADTLLFKWAKRLLIAFLLLLAIRTLFFILNPEWGEFGKKFWYYVCFSILFYFISVSGYVNSVPSLVSFQDFTDDVDDDRYHAVEQNNSDTNDKQRDEIYELTKWKEKIEHLMLHDKLYKNQELIISDLAKTLETHSKKVSEIINQGFDLNFNDFINQYRSQAVIHRLEKGDHHKVTLLSIALDCGFNSKSTFNRAFKRYTMLSPKEFIEKNIEQ